MKQFKERLAGVSTRWFHGHWLKGALATVVILFVLLVILGIYWSGNPAVFNVADRAETFAAEHEHERVVGYTTSVTLREVARTLLDKPGGYLTNDKLPPGVWLDNMGNWEFGVVIQIRDLSRALRKDLSRSQSQSTEDQDLAEAEPNFNFDNNSWLLPATESRYEDGIHYLERYIDRLADPTNPKAQFYARADNLRTWLMDVETRLGSLSQRLSASVGQIRLNTDLAGDAAAEQSTAAASQSMVKTSWLEIDDVFYEARGTAWALVHFLKAMEVDFAAVLERKNALVSLRQIIRELEATQETVWSPMILNGSGFGFVANHSLVMANYISRANAAIIDLRRLLETG